MSPHSPHGNVCQLQNTTQINIHQPDVLAQLDADANNPSSCTFIHLNQVATQTLWLDTLLQIDDDQILYKLQQCTDSNTPTQQVNRM